MENNESSNFEFEIIAGALKGRRIQAPKLSGTRPPLSRIRRAIFDFLNPYLDEASYLDLFSGTGSYLFEAVSRHARLAHGVEFDRRLAQSINDQAIKFGIGDRLTCGCNDVFLELPELARQDQMFDVVMIAPPQYQGLIDRTLELLSQYRLVEPNGLILCQHDTSETDNLNFGDRTVTQQRRYGNTTFTVLSPGGKT